MKRSGTIALFLLLMPAATQAQQLPRAGQVDALIRCRAEADAEVRLRCFDAAARQLEEALAGGTVVAVDRQRAQSDEFGRRNSSGLPDLGDAPRELASTITASSEAGFGNWQLQLANGQVWRTTEHSRGATPPPRGTAVRITRGLTGGFWLIIRRERPQRITRIR